MRRLDPAPDSLGGDNRALLFVRGRRWPLYPSASRGPFLRTSRHASSSSARFATKPPVATSSASSRPSARLTATVVRVPRARSSRPVVRRPSRDRRENGGSLRSLCISEDEPVVLHSSMSSALASTASAPPHIAPLPPLR